jgi:lysostaphin
LQIILVHQRLAQARTYTVSRWTAAAVVSGGLLLLLLLALVIDVVLLQSGLTDSVPGLRQLAQGASRLETAQNDRATRENMKAMALKLAEMQAQLMRLEALGERVSGLAGINPKEFNLGEPPPRGGETPVGGHDITMNEFNSQLDTLSQGLERRGQPDDVQAEGQDDADHLAGQRGLQLVGFWLAHRSLQWPHGDA